MDLGITKGTVRIVPHQPEWERVFQLEQKLLERIFAGNALAIEHVGSTAVPALQAKPIIDLAVRVVDIAVVQLLENALSALGYAERENRLKGHQRVFVRSDGEAVTHHLHVIQADCPEWDRKILFRDCLRRHPEIGQAYEALKLRLWRMVGNDRGAYTDGKRSFIDSVVAKATQENQLVTDEPDPTRIQSPPAFP